MFHGAPRRRVVRPIREQHKRSERLFLPGVSIVDMRVKVPQQIDKSIKPETLRRCIGTTKSQRLTVPSGLNSNTIAHENLSWKKNPRVRRLVPEPSP